MLKTSVFLAVEEGVEAATEDEMVSAFEQNIMQMIEILFIPFSLFTNLGRSFKVKLLINAI